MTANPIDIVIVNNVPVVKADLRGYEKLRVRQRVADATEIRNTDFSGQYGGLYVRATQFDYDLDPTDTTTADDGVACIIDNVGNRFKKRVIAAIAVANYREVTAAGDITVTSDDQIIGVNKTVGAATNVNMGLAGDGENAVTIKDVKGDAETNNITPVLSGGELIDGLPGSSFAITTNFGAITLNRRAGAWYTI